MALLLLSLAAETPGLALINALTDAQRAQAVLCVSKTANDNLIEAWRDNVVLDYAGIRAPELDARQRQKLLDLVALYVNNMDEGHARVKMDEVRARSHGRQDSER